MSRFRKEQPFTPPTAQQVEAHLARNPPTGPSKWSVWLPLAAMAMVIAMTFTIDHVMMAVLPWVAFFCVMAALGWRVNRLKELERRVTLAQELTMLRRVPQSLRLSWRLLSEVRATPELHGRVVAMIALDLDMLRAHDAAIVTYDYLIDRLPEEHPGSVQLRIQRVMAHLATDQLLDADQSLRRLRGVVERFAGTAIAATYRVASLFQQVRTNHFADAVAEAGNLLEDLRPLGIEAAYGHAMMALSHHRLAEAGDDKHREPARMWWARATLLMTPDALADRFTELAPLAQGTLPATPDPRSPRHPRSPRIPRPPM